MLARMRILLVEDDPSLGASLESWLRLDGYAVDWVQRGDLADTALRTHDYGCVLLDRGLPGLDGDTLLTTLRARQAATPVLMITARDAIEDRVQGLDMGADDYLVKPFDVDELKARIRALLRRSQGRAQPLLEHAGVRLDPARFEVRYRDQPVSLTPMEFRLLHQLLARPGTVLTRERLADVLYGWQESGPGNTLEVLIHNLRRKLDSGLIRTVRGVGYLIEDTP